jgi:type VI secretion system secreted protein VgrG
VEQLSARHARVLRTIRRGSRLFRLLAEDGNASFFDHANGSAFTLISNTRNAVDLVGDPVPFSDPSNLNPIIAKDPTAPRISAVTFAACLTTSATTIRSSDFERPALVLEEKSAIPAARLLPNETRWSRTPSSPA